MQKTIKIFWRPQSARPIIRRTVARQQTRAAPKATLVLASPSCSKRKPRADGGYRRGAVPCLGDRLPAVHRKFALTVVAQSIDLKVGDLKVEGQRTSRTSAGRATLKGRTPIPSPRIARAGRGERAATFDTDGTLNIPLRQKEALSRPTKRRLSEPGSYIHSAI
jgi:hypothetical protein